MMTTVAKALLTLHMFISFISPKAEFNQVNGLPITSKPIESTAENLAWQAWIMMPPHEQNLEKSRKVTPKSIFLLPNRVKVPMPEGQAWTAEAESGSGLYAPIECPPGQRQFESRCISTLDIDREQLLIQELQILLQHGSNNNQNVYDYDYDYDEEAIAAVEANYKPPMMFKGDELPSGSVSGNYDDAARLPNEDAPLKFNIFSENYPTDEELQHKQVNGLEMSNVNSSDPWSLAQFFATSQAPNATIPLSEVDGTEMELEKAAPTTARTSSATTVKTMDMNSGIPITGIDAIVLPAVATQPQLQKFSFFKDNSGMELVTTVDDRQNVVDTTTTKQQQQQAQEFLSQLTDLLKFDSLLPLQSPVIALSTPTTTSTATTLATTATLKATTLKALTSTTTATTKKTLTTVTSPKTAKTASEELDAAITNAPKQLTALLDADDRVASEEQQKEERTRSVTLSNSALTATATNEPETTIDLLPTTLMPATLTPNANSKQLDQTANVAEAVEAAEDSQKLKKSKVEPVEEKSKHADDDLFVSQATPLPTPRTVSTQQKVVDDHDDKLDDDHDEDLVDDHDDDHDGDHSGDDDRFYSQPVDGVETTVDNFDAGGQHEVGASTLPQLISESSSTTTATMPTTTTTTTTKAMPTVATTMSEIDVAAELRAINELVKKSNRRQGASKKKTTAAAKATKNELATTTTKATSRSKTSPISEQQLAVKTENSVDFDRDATTSASSETTATTTETGSSLIDASTSTMTTTTAATTAVTIDEATATATLWAKIMPLLGFGVTTITTEPPVTATSPTTATATAISSSNNSSNSSISSSSRSLRNSKITRIDNLSTNSLSDNAKKSTTTPTTAITTTKTNGGSRSRFYVIPLLPATSTELPFSGITTKATTADDGSFSPFWWLPAGWRLDRPNSGLSTPATSNNNSPNVVGAGEPSLLLRFWSAFPGNQVKIKD